MAKLSATMSSANFHKISPFHSVFRVCRYHARSILNFCGARNVTRAFSTSTISDVVNGCSVLEKLPKNVTVNGWVKSVRQHKDTAFITLSDGTSASTLQVVAHPQLLNGVEYGACVSVTGDVVDSPYRQQKFEVKATDVKVVGQCDSNEYPFKAKVHHSPDYTRQFPHLRPKTHSFSRLLRVRNNARVGLHKYFQDAGYYHIDTPIITSNDCEGAGEAFYVKTNEEVDCLKSGQEKSHFFGTPAFLTVSGQLHLEVATGSFPRVYTLGPTFRAEKSSTRHHLSEFYMLEAEVAFMEDLSQLTDIIEKCVKKMTENLLESSQDDITQFWTVAGKGQQENILKMLDSPFHRISYTDAIEILLKDNDRFQFKVSWGCDLQKEHERYLVAHFGYTPVFVCDFPASLKPFYAKPNSQANTVVACDLLVPGVGELVGGSLRNCDVDSLSQRLKDDGLHDKLQWYLDLRRFGGSPHGGFGMGFERYLQYLLGVKQIRDVIPFPRALNSCKL